MHATLHRRRLYPAAAFAPRRYYDGLVELQRCEHPGVADYVCGFLRDCREPLLANSVRSLALVVFADKSGAPLERHEFRPQLLGASGVDLPAAALQPGLHELMRQLAGMLTRMAASDACLPPLPDGAPRVGRACARTCSLLAEQTAPSALSLTRTRRRTWGGAGCVTARWRLRLGRAMRPPPPSRWTRGRCRPRASPTRSTSKLSHLTIVAPANVRQASVPARSRIIHAFSFFAVHPPRTRRIRRPCPRTPSSAPCRLASRPSRPPAGARPAPPCPPSLPPETGRPARRQSC